MKKSIRYKVLYELLDENGNVVDTKDGVAEADTVAIIGATMEKDGLTLESSVQGVRDLSIQMLTVVAEGIILEKGMDLLRYCSLKSLMTISQLANAHGISIEDVVAQLIEDADLKMSYGTTSNIPKTIGEGLSLYIEERGISGEETKEYHDSCETCDKLEGCSNAKANDYKSKLQTEGVH